MGLVTISTSEFRVDGPRAYLDGTLGTRTYNQLKTLIAQNAQVDTIVLGQVPGSGLRERFSKHAYRLSFA